MCVLVEVERGGGVMPPPLHHAMCNEHQLLDQPTPTPQTRILDPLCCAALHPVPGSTILASSASPLSLSVSPVPTANHGPTSIQYQTGFDRPLLAAALLSSLHVSVTVNRRLLTDEDPALRERLIQVLFQGGRFQWARLTNLVQLAREGSSSSSSTGDGFPLVPLPPSSSGARGLDLSDTVRDAARLLLLDEGLRRQAVMALTEDNQLHLQEVQQLLALLGSDVSPGRLVQQVVADLPSIGRQAMLAWADRVLVS
jgi:hypothetical protein